MFAGSSSSSLSGAFWLAKYVRALHLKELYPRPWNAVMSPFRYGRRLDSAKPSRCSSAAQSINNFVCVNIHRRIIGLHNIKVNRNASYILGYI
jgi:hypothetical protein